MYEMKKMICMVMTVASLTYTTQTMAQSPGLQKKVNTYFLQSLKAQQKALEKEGKAEFAQNAPLETKLQQAIEGKDIASYQKMVWSAWCDANRNLQEEKLIEPEDLKLAKNSSWNLPKCLEPNAVMPYYYGKKGVAADGKFPLFLYIHGSGPKDREWSNGIKLGLSFQDSPSIYFIPQIPNEGEYYRWWHLSKQYAFEKLIRQNLVNGEVDANRLYVFGISEGGYGSQRLASFYADYWAAAGPMAGGEPLKNAPVENCANIGFSFLTGADDTGFYRNDLTWYTQVAFDSAQLARPLAVDKTPIFRHRIHLLPGMQHHITYGLTTPWLKQFVRNPYPKTVLWEDFEMDIDQNVVSIKVSNVDYTTTMKDKQWGIDLKFNRSYSVATGGKLRVYLNDQLVDLGKPVTIRVNGKQVFHGIAKADLQAMVNSCAEYFDPCRVYPVAVDLAY